MDEEEGGFMSALSGIFSAGMGMNPYIAAGQAALGVGQKIASFIQRRNAEKNFTNMTIPSSVYKMLGEARSLTKPNFPYMDLYRSNAFGYGAKLVEGTQRTAETAGQVLGQTGNIYDKYLGFERNLALKGLEERRQGKAAYMQALAQLSEWEHKKWQYNELMPYYQKMSLAGQMDVSGNQNIGSSIGSMLSMGTANWEMGQRRGMFQDWKDAQLDFIKEQGNQNRMNGNFNNNPYDYQNVPNYNYENFG